MAIIYSGLNVDETYAKTFEPNLFYNSFLVPGVTYTDKYKAQAGGIFVPKLTGVAPTEPGTPGRDFTMKKVTDELIQIALLNNYMESDKAYDVQIGNIAAPMKEHMFRTVTEKVREGREQSALACLVKEGTASDDHTALTGNNLKTRILAERTALSKKKGTADVILVNPDVYSTLLEIAGKEFTPIYNDRVQGDGRVGNWLGFKIFEVNALAFGGNSVYYNHAGAKQTVTNTDLNKVDFIMLNSMAFSVVDNLTKFKLEDGGILFNGVAAQAEVNTGFRVTNAELVRVHAQA